MNHHQYDDHFEFRYDDNKCLKIGRCNYMEKYLEQLTELLLKENSHLTYSQAKIWVEWLWEDFEATYAKAGEYHGEQMSKKVVQQFIFQYGKYLHETDIKIAKPPGLEMIETKEKDNLLH